MKSPLLTLSIVSLLLTGCSTRNIDLNSAINDNIDAFKINVVNANYIGDTVFESDPTIPQYYYDERLVLNSSEPIGLNVFLKVLQINHPELTVNTGHVTSTAYNAARSFKFNGSLKESLDYAGDLYNVFFTINHNTVTVESEKFFTDSFDFSGVTDGDFALDAGIAKDSSGSFKSNLKFDEKGDFWSELEKSLGLILPSSKFTLSIQNGTVSYLADRREKNRVDNYLSALRAQYNTQFQVTYKVISVESSIARKFGIGTTLGIENGADTTITSPEVTFLDYINYSDKNLEVLLELGQEEGKLKAIQEGSFLVRNGHTIPINVLNNIEYISEISVVTSDFSESQSITTEELSTGISISLKPKALSDGTIELVSGFSKSELVSLEKVSGVMLPSTSEVESFSRTLMVPGEYVVISSFDDSKVDGDSTFKTTSFTDRFSDKNSKIVVIASITYD